MWNSMDRHKILIRCYKLIVKYDQIHTNILCNILVSDHRIIWDQQCGFYVTDILLKRCSVYIKYQRWNGNGYSALTIHKLQDSHKGEVNYNILTEFTLPEN